MKTEEIWELPVSELTTLLVAGRAVDPEVLAGASYRGVSLGLPGLIERLTWKTFRKSFRKTATGVDGFNVRLEQHGVDAPPVARKDRRGNDVAFGPFAVDPLPAHRTPFGCDVGALFDYGKRHPAWHPMARARDVVVALDDDHQVLLGALYMDIAGALVRTPSFFTLEREPAVTRS